MGGNSVDTEVLVEWGDRGYGHRVDQGDVLYKKDEDKGNMDHMNLSRKSRVDSRYRRSFGKTERV